MEAHLVLARFAANPAIGKACAASKTLVSHDGWPNCFGIIVSIVAFDATALARLSRDGPSGGIQLCDGRVIGVAAQAAPTVTRATISALLFGDEHGPALHLAIWLPIT